MRKKILSIFAIVLSVALLMTCFPTIAFADDTETTLYMTGA